MIPTTMSANVGWKIRMGDLSSNTGHEVTTPQLHLFS